MNKTCQTAGSKIITIVTCAGSVHVHERTAIVGGDGGGKSLGEKRMAEITKIRVNEILDDAPLGRLQILALVICTLTVVMDGFDTYSVGYVGPFIVKEWAISPQFLGVIFSGSMISGILGSIAIAPLADRVGRRRMLVIANLMFGAASLLGGWAPDPNTFLVARIITGVGLGAVFPNATAMMADYAPKSYRSTFPMWMSACMAIGMIIAGSAAAMIIPALGWRSLFYICGIVPIVWAVVIGTALPESIRFLVLQRPNDPVLRKLLLRLDPSKIPDGPCAFYLDEERSPDSPVREIFKGQRARLTITLWFGNSLIYTVTFFIAYWLPSLMMHIGYSIQQTALVIISLKSGAIIGTYVLGRMMDRWGESRVLIPSFAIAAICMVVFGLTADNFAMCLVVIFVTGLFEGGSYSGILGYAANFYPTAIRSTGLGWVLGGARGVASIGPLIGGFLFAGGLSTPAIAACIAVPLALDAIVVGFLRRMEPRRDMATDEHLISASEVRA